MRNAHAAQFAAYVQAMRQFAGDARLAVTVGLMAGGALIEGVGLLMLLPILNALDAEGWASVTLGRLGDFSLPLAGWLGLFLVLVALRTLLTRTRDVATARLRIGFADHLRLELQAALGAAEWRFLAGLGHARLLQALTADLPRISYGTYMLLQLVVNILVGGVALAVAAALSPALTAITLAIGGLLWWRLRGRLDAAHALGERLSASNEALLQSASDFLAGLKLIKSSAAEAAHLDEFSHNASALGEMEIEFIRGQATTRAAYAGGSALLFAALLLFAAQGLHLPKSELLVILLIFARLLPLGHDLHGAVEVILHMLPAFAQTRELRDQADAAAEPTATADATAPALGDELRLQQVSFRHRAGGPQTLADIDLTIAARSTTALVGPSGAGKTTLADLLLGLTAPDTGTLLVDGEPLAGGQRRDWRRAAGYVPQDAFLFPGTVRENLFWATRDGAEADLWQALELAAAADFVRRLPQGLDTPVGERGIRLSGGERQRIALARALLRRPQLLVLDEATSHLDSENENLIQRALEHLHGKLTLVVIAHRLSTVRHADRIVVIEGGRIVETDDWDTLVRHGGRFSEILDASISP